MFVCNISEWINKELRKKKIKFPRATYHTVVPSTEELYCFNSGSTIVHMRVTLQCRRRFSARQLVRFSRLTRLSLSAGGVRHEIWPIRTRHLCRHFRSRKEPLREVYEVKFSLFSTLIILFSELYLILKFLEYPILVLVRLSLKVNVLVAFMRSSKWASSWKPPCWFHC